MRDFDQSLLFIVAVVILGLVFFMIPKSSNTAVTPLREPAGAAPGRSEKAKANPPAPNDSDSLRPLRHFVEFDDEAGRSLPRLPKGADMDRLDIDFLVVMVPDPIDSRFAYSFDTAVDAVQLAVESQNYSLDRFWLPWAPTGEQPRWINEKAGDEDESRVGSAMTLHEREPGVLLFRGKPDDAKGRARLKMVFLIGESSLSGVHKVALARGLRIMRNYEALKRPGAPAGARPVRVVGPYFSGSADSLALTLNRWAAGNVPGHGNRVEVVTGSATVVDPGRFKRQAGGADVTFSSTVLPDRYVLKGIVDFLTRTNGSVPDKIAILSESDTAYGNEIESKWEEGRVTKVMLMKFPFHISQVRAAHRQDRESANWPIPNLSQPRNRLRIPFDELGSPKDTVPALSPGMTASIDEFLISRVLQTIYREDFRYIGIVASDSRDTIFLADLVRSICPDAQLFTNLSDVLLAHPDFSHRLRGMIVSSSYPLYSNTQRWTYPFAGDRFRRLFHSQSDQGIYNAVLAQMAAAGAPGAALSMLDYGIPFEPVTDPGAPPPTRRPPLWINVIGQQGLWPLEFQTPAPGGRAKPAGVDVSYDDYVYGLKGVAAKPAAQGASRKRLYVPLFTWNWAVVFVPFTFLVAWLVLTNFGATLRSLRPDPARAPAAGPGLHQDQRRMFTRLMTPPTSGLAGGRYHVYHFLYVLGLSGTAGLCYFWFSTPCLFLLQSETFRRLLDRSNHASWSDTLNALFSIMTPLVMLTALTLLIASVLARLVLLLDRLRTTRRVKRTLRRIVAGLSGVYAAVASRVGRFVPEPIRRRTRRGTGWVRSRVSSALYGVTDLLTRPTRDLISWVNRLMRSERAFARLTVAASLVLCAGIWVVLMVGLWNHFRTVRVAGGHIAQASANLMFFERATALSNGVSPLMPALSLGLVCVSYFYCQLRRLYLLDRFQGCGMINTPPPRDSVLYHVRRRIKERADKLDACLRRPYPWPLRHPGLLLPLLLLFLTFVRLSKKFVSTFDDFWFCCLMVSFFVVLSLAVVMSFFRLWLIWGHLEKLFRELTFLPMLHAYERVPSLLTRMYGRYLDNLEPRFSHLTIAVQQWAQVALHFDEARPGIERALADDDDPQEQAREIALSIKIQPDAPGVVAARHIHDQFESDLYERGEYGDIPTSPTRTSLCDAATACLDILLHIWPTTPASEGYGDGPPSRGPKPAAVPTGAATAPDDDEPLNRWIRSAEELVAVELATSVRQYTVHLRNLSTFLTVGPLLLLLTVTSYPFQPGRLLMVMTGTIVALVVGGVLIIYVRIDRNEFLSHISKTPPDRITFDRTFLASVLTYTLPLVGVILAGFPDASDLMNTWLEPLSRFLK